MKIENILLPFDGSTHSTNATNYCLNLAKLYKAHVTIIFCYDEGNWNLSGISDSLLEGIKSNRKLKANEKVKTAGSIFKNQGVEYRLETVAGLPGDVLTSLSRSKAYDLIIMGSHGHSDITGLFLGSVTHKVLNTIYCPILIVP